MLFYYLRFTRNFEFMDAEHISRNSPNFIHNLLSKIESEQGPTYSLSKFLRCRPINEFEPFFESLGLSPSEYSSLLPQNLLFLTDDHMLLNNFHVLCNYGIPRVKIGRMYKEATGIFRYEDGVMDLKLRAYEELGLSRSTVIKLVSCCPLLLVGSVSKEVIGVIDKLKILGIESDWIRGSLSGKMSYNWNRMIDIMDFLDKVGFTDEQQGILFRKNPAILTEGSTMNIHVLIARLLKSGLKLNDIFSLIMQNPQILAGKCAKNLWQAVRFLSKIGTEIGDMTKIIATHTRLLASHSWKAPGTIMKEMEFKKDHLQQILKEDPLKLISLASKCKTSSASKHMEKGTFLLKLGYLENSDEMEKALRNFRGRGDELQERFDCLVRAGLDSHEVSNMVKRSPQVLNQTKDMIEKKINFLRNCLHYPVEFLVASPSYLHCNMERVKLRFTMYVWLLEKGMTKPKALSTIYSCSDDRFVKHFVNIHPNGPSVWESLNASSASRLKKLATSDVNLAHQGNQEMVQVKPK